MHVVVDDGVRVRKIKRHAHAAASERNRETPGVQCVAGLEASLWLKMNAATASSCAAGQHRRDDAVSAGVSMSGEITYALLLHAMVCRKSRNLGRSAVPQWLDFVDERMDPRTGDARQPAMNIGRTTTYIVRQCLTTLSGSCAGSAPVGTRPRGRRVGDEFAVP